MFKTATPWTMRLRPPTVWTHEPLKAPKIPVTKAVPAPRPSFGAKRETQGSSKSVGLPLAA